MNPLHFPAAAGVPRPGLLWGPYPERAEALEDTPPRRAPGLRRSTPQRRVATVRALMAQLQALDDTAFDAHGRQVQQRLAGEGLSPAALEQALAQAAEAARRTLGKTAYDGQLLAALHMLDEHLVEMATGEGKSLATALAAATAGLSGMPVHVLTANDYLVQRDAHDFAPLYRRLGLDVAAVVAGMCADERRQAYGQPVVVVTAKELVFDYLRDRTRAAALPSPLSQRAAALGAPAAAPLLRGLCMALVDEADSVLIDEAQMPLILSHEVNDTATRAWRWQAWTMSAQLKEHDDFVLDAARRQATLTVVGQHRLEQMARPLAAAWQSTRHRDQAVATALVARHLYELDRDYVVHAVPDGAGGTTHRIAIVDPVTGRIAEGRRWAQGLHGMVAMKEGLKPEAELETLAQITFQRFFRRYHRLGGLSGTLSEARGELRAFYGLPIVRVAPRLPCQRVQWPTRLFADDAARWQAVRQRCAELSALGRPVLVGTDSVADSQALSAVLHAAGLAHAVLNARHDADEATIVARAGEAGRITVATNMAGRGTDIAPDAYALLAGGLHVLSCQLNPTRRLDRQLAGRAARQGQPGSSENWLSLDSKRFSAHRAGRFTATMLGLVLHRQGGALATRWLRCWQWGLQRWEEQRQTRARSSNFKNDCQAEGRLAFAASA